MTIAFDAPADLSARFFALTPERILDAVERVGRRSTGYALALGSLENRVYEVELEDGERVVAKFYRPGRWSRDALLEEHALLAELTEAEVPAAAPLLLDGGAGTLAEMDAAEGSEGAMYFAVFPKVRGRPPEDLDEERLEWLGRLIARLHAVGARRGAPGRGRLDAASYGEASLAVLRAGEFIPDFLARRYFDVAERLVEACARALERWPAPTHRIHGDCHPGNLLWGAMGPFFLDFDDFLEGPAVQDLWLLCPGHDDEGRRQRACIVEGYRTLRDFDDGWLQLVEPLRALRILRYAAWIARRHGDPAFARAFPGFTEAAFWQREIAAVEEQAARVQEVVVA